MGKDRESRRKSMVPGVRVKLERAEGLRAADRNGKSDPYCAFKLAKSKHKSKIVYKNLNPDWQEEFFLEAAEFTSIPLKIDVYDHDTIGSDDFLGRCEVDISHVPVDGSNEKFQVELVDKKGKNEGSLGTLYFSVRRSEQAIGKSSSKSKKWAASKGERRVIVEVVEGMDLIPMDNNGLSDPYLVLKLGGVKHKTKVVNYSLNPKWQERFEFPMKDDGATVLSLECWDKDTFSRDDCMGKAKVKLDALQVNNSHDEWHSLELNGSCSGHVRLQITVVDQSGDLILTKEQRSQMVGTLKCHIIRAEGLAAADFMSSDPYCELAVGSARLRTHTIKKNLNPEWDQVIELPVKDVFSTLVLSVWDEDNGGKSRPDFLGKITVPLYEIKNNHTVWCRLKKEDSLRPGKGSIQVAFNLSYKIPKAYMGAIKRRDLNLMEKKPKFSVKRLLNAVNRLNAINMVALEGAVFAWEVLNWRKNPAFSVAGLIGWNIVCLLFRLWMVPLALMIAIILGKFVHKSPGVRIDENGMLVPKTSAGKDLTGLNKLNLEQQLDGEDVDEEDAGADEPEAEIEGSAPKSEGKKKGGKKSKKGLMAQLGILQEIGALVQDKVEFAASLEERIANLANWSVPLLTQVAVAGLAVATVVLLLVPFNILLLLAGNFQFTKRFVRRYIAPRSKFHRPIIEAVEFISRVPSDMEKAQRAPLPLTEDKKSMKATKSQKLLNFHRKQA